MAKRRETVAPPLAGDEALLKEARDRLAGCIDEESALRAEMLEDLRFSTLDQWDVTIRKGRESDPNGARPCLTIDKTSQYIVQVVNDIRKNRPAIQTRPVDDAADIETAKVFKGLVRNIEDQSNASVCYETAGEWAARVGLGYVGLTTDYVSADSFEQEIKVRLFPNTFAVYLGPHIMPDGSDAEYGFVIEETPLAKFEKLYPKAKTKDEDFVGVSELPSWKTAETVTVAEYFRIINVEKELLYLENGKTVSRDQYDNKTTIKKTRPSKERKVEWFKITGIEILEKREWAGQWIPIVEVIGNQAYVDGRRVLWGLVRPIKDPQRMYNIWASAVTEKIGLAPKSPYVVAEGQIEGRDTEWQNANRENRAVLQYKPIDLNGNLLPPPRRQEPAQVEVAMVQQMQTMEHDIQTAVGMYKASVGESESQQSGRAILALQRESDTGTFHYSDNLSRSIRHLGRMIVDLAPKIYDTRRVLRIIGEDGEPAAITVDPGQAEARRDIQTAQGVKRIYNLAVGKYDVTVTVGPSYTTARQEAATVLTELANSAKDPASAAVMRYLAVKNSDFHGSEEMVRMLKALLPPQVNQPEDAPVIPPQALMKMQEMQGVIQMMGEDLQKMKSGRDEAMAKIQAGHAQKMEELRLKAESDAEELRQARMKTEEELRLKAWIAEQEMAIELVKLQASAEVDIDAAIEKVKALAAHHEMKMEAMMEAHKAEQESEQQGEQQATDMMGMMHEMHQNFMQAIEQIVRGLSAKKRINLIRDAEGRPQGAEVMMQ